jgi:hypothetical protein
MTVHIKPALLSQLLHNHRQTSRISMHAVGEVRTERAPLFIAQARDRLKDLHTARLRSGAKPRVKCRDRDSPLRVRADTWLLLVAVLRFSCGWKRDDGEFDWLSRPGKFVNRTHVSSSNLFGVLDDRPTR